MVGMSFSMGGARRLKARTASQVDKQPKIDSDISSLTLYGSIFRLQRKKKLRCFFEILTHPMWGKNAICFFLPPIDKLAAILYFNAKYEISVLFQP